MMLSLEEFLMIEVVPDELNSYTLVEFNKVHSNKTNVDFYYF